MVRTETRGPETLVTRHRDTQVGTLAPGADMVTGAGLGHRVIGDQVVEVGSLSDQLISVTPELVRPEDGAGVSPVEPVLKNRDTFDERELTESE